MCDPTDVRVALNECRKVFVQRDYTHGLAVRFQTEFPEQLENWIDVKTWQDSISALNKMFDEAERVGGGSVLETVVGCLTCYTSRMCMPTQYEKKLQEISAFLEQQNRVIYMPRALFITDPMERGLRVLEISLLAVPSTQVARNAVNSAAAPMLRTGPT